MPKTDEYNPSWDLESGLADEYDLKIEDAYATFDAEYNDGQTCLVKLEGKKTIDGEVSDEVLQLSCGNGWEPKDKGARVAREDGNTKKTFNKNSGFGLFLQGVRNTEAFSLLKDADVRDMSIWKGLSFRLQRKEIDYGGEIGKKDKMVPTEFLGSGKGGGKAKASSSDDGEADAKLPPKVKKAIKKVAEETVENGGDHDAFVEAAFALDEVNGVAAAESAVMDSGEGSIWAEAVADNEE